MGHVEQMTKHFGEIDAYMTEKMQVALDARNAKDYTQLDAIVAQVREDGYPQFAEQLANLETTE